MIEICNAEMASKLKPLLWRTRTNLSYTANTWNSFLITQFIASLWWHPTRGVYYPPLTLSQCTLTGPVYTGMPLECYCLTQCTLGYHWATQRILAGYTGTPLEKLSLNSPALECHWRNIVGSAPHWDATGETFCSLHWNTTGGTVTAHTRPTHIIKHAKSHPCHFEMTRWRDTSKQGDRSLYIQPLLGVYCSAMATVSVLNTCEYFNITLCMPL